MKLGKLQEVDIRTVWPHEQYDFSKWLSDEVNIKELGDILNLSFTDIETEKFVGSYRCDICCPFGRSSSVWSASIFGYFGIHGTRLSGWLFNLRKGSRSL